MDPDLLLTKFNPNLGRDAKTLSSYTSLEEVAGSLKKGNAMSSYQLISRILYLTGETMETVTLAAAALSHFVHGGQLPDLTPLVGKPVGVITVLCGRHEVYKGFVETVSVISLDRGQTWLDFDGYEVAVRPLKVWMARLFHKLCSLLPLYLNDDRLPDQAGNNAGGWREDLRRVR